LSTISLSREPAGGLAAIPQAPSTKEIYRVSASTKVRKHFQEANDALRQDLGMARSTLREDHPYDIRHQILVSQLQETPLPLFHWGWSEDPDYRHPMRLLNSDGTKQFELRCACGVNVREDEHSETCSKAVVAAPVYHVRRILDFPMYRNFNGERVHNEWVLWRWLPPPSRIDWEAEFGTSLSYDQYKSGAWEPCSSMKMGTDGLQVAFVVSYPKSNRHERTVIMDFTRMCIAAYKQRTARAAGLDPAMSLAQIEEARKKRVENTAEMIEDKLFTGWGKHIHLPGDKGSGRKFPISFPSVSTSKA
jgi:hypothetical protein